jgi:hypothetical protein
MAKQSGLGDNFYIGGFDLSGDVGQLQRIAQPSELLDATAINKSARERIFGHKDGALEWQTFFNDAAGQQHLALRSLNRNTNLVAQYFRGTALGGPVAQMQGLQMNYDPNRGADGSLTIDLKALANGFGLEWGQSLTAGKRTDGGATAPASGADFVDVSTAFGLAAYLQVFAFTGTSVTFTIQDSADNAAFANITGLSAFTTVSAAPAYERIETDNLTRTIRRYMKVNTTGTFSNCIFAVSVIRYTGANRDT